MKKAKAKQPAASRTSKKTPAAAKGKIARRIPDDILRNTYTKDRPAGLHVRVLWDHIRAAPPAT